MSDIYFLCDWIYETDTVPIDSNQQVLWQVGVAVLLLGGILTIVNI